MRLIDGDALKKRVKESTAILSVKVLAETLINTAPTITAVSVPQWISVKDRLPEPDENPVIAGCEPFNLVFMSWYDSKTKRWELPSKFACEVTHWMLTSSLPRKDGAE